jgi:Thioredoxin-like
MTSAGFALHRLIVIALLASSLSSSPVRAEAPAAPVAPAHPEATLYDPARDAAADVDAALTRARLSGKRLIIVLGANWCHDSKALAGWFETARFKTMLSAYELVYVDVGKPQIGEGRNLDIAKRFGAKAIKGTPTVLLISPDGKLLNRRDAPGWRNAASRSEADIYAYFADFGRP